MTAHSLVLTLEALVREKDGSFLKSFLTDLCGRLLFRAESKFSLSLFEPYAFFFQRVRYFRQQRAEPFSSARVT